MPASKIPARGSIVLLVTLLLAGCRPGPRAPSSDSEPPPMRPVAEVIAAHAPELMKIPGVAGVYEGETRDHTPCVRVMVVKRTKELDSRLPRKLDGYPVEVEETGVIRPLGQP